MLPEMIFVLASPRSGSTMLRAMLAGHPGLFSPPELNLLPFSSMREREMRLGAAAFCVVPCDQRVGLIEAIMHLRGEDALRSVAWLQGLVQRDAPIAEMYGLLREMAAPRRIVDKSTLNCSCVAFLERSHRISEEARYIHLVRHPYSSIDSLRRTYFHAATSWEWFQDAEALWAVPNQNILRFLQTLPPGQHCLVRFEDLVGDPEKTMRKLCDFLGLPFDRAVLTPYGKDRMIEGSPGQFRSLGDPNLLDHDSVDASLGEIWRHVTLPCELGPLAKQLSNFFRYQVRSRQSTSQQTARQTESFILIVPPFTYRAEAYINASRRRGLSPLCALDPRFGVPHGVDSYLPISFDFPECAAQIVINHYMSRRSAGLLSVDDGGAVIAALASQALGLPHNPPEALEATRNKYAMRMLFRRAGVPSPHFRACMLHEDPVRTAKELDYPVVLKPLHLTGSRGVIRANDPVEFVAAFVRIGKLLARPDMGRGPDRILVESYIPGDEVSVDGILIDGKLWPLAIYDKPDRMEGPFFEETIFITPSRRSSQMQEQIVRHAELAALSIGLRTGPVHVELRVNDDGPWLLEVAARTMGGYCSRALPFENGRTLEELVVSQAAGLQIDEFRPAPGAHGVMMLPIPGEGTYRSVAGTREAESTPGITGLMITIAEGSVVTPLPEGDKYIGFLFAGGENPDAVERALRDAHSRLSFKLDPIKGSRSIN